MKDSQDKFRKLEVACFAKEHKSDDILGRGSVDITDTLKTGEFDGTFQLLVLHPPSSQVTPILEWVPLNVDGVVRGDLYLEMTFFSNTPVPTSSLAPPSSSLQRRPSKLPQSERLSRPAHTAAPAEVLHHLLSDDNRRVNSPLPPLPQEVTPAPLPSTLLPGSGRPKPSGFQHNSPSVGVDPRRHERAESYGSNVQHPTPSPSSRTSSATHQRPEDPLPGAAAVAGPPPSTLLPGGGRPRPPRNQTNQTAHLPNQLPAHPQHSSTGQAPHSELLPHGRQSSYSSFSPRTEYFAGPTSPTYRPNSPPSHTPYNGRVDIASPVLGPAFYTPSSPTIASTQQWAPENAVATFSFPVPTVGPPIETGGFHQSRSPSYIEPPPSYGYPPPRDNFPDPYLQVRYQTPLPLPPGSMSPPRQTPQLPTVANPLHQAPQSPEDQVRINAQREYEEAAARRKTQEDKDLELAMQLDRELNLQEESAARGTRTNSMPGGWP
ncbi:hypothetical protein H0H81_003705 [Sphagnurus paluster]|uniref:Uncharacterized protein n=1 Tax=Sphagnurus paluster TaxID=117069 RepID=A0A9P7GTP7_9AGAR|nr:hypothetical protein H0H81_003705 [Sphagnurus paluster]